MPRHPLLAALVSASLLPLSLPAPATAEVRLPPVLSSHMVLQRDMPAPIWGTAVCVLGFATGTRAEGEAAAVRDVTLISASDCHYREADRKENHNDLNRRRAKG